MVGARRLELGPTSAEPQDGRSGRRLTSTGPSSLEKLIEPDPGLLLREPANLVIVHVVNGHFSIEILTLFDNISSPSSGPTEKRAL